MTVIISSSRVQASKWYTICLISKEVRTIARVALAESSPRFFNGLFATLCVTRDAKEELGAFLDRPKPEWEAR